MGFKTIEKMEKVETYYDRVRCTFLLSELRYSYVGLTNDRQSWMAGSSESVKKGRVGPRGQIETGRTAG